ncbi:Zinc ABC transporter, ATP-binding protein ZnuC [hydrothermal vent metagenome]|uniref:Zinc ABC transporter, ATP-binding protein ZnuC n=1 Tax=hydrothermal vent metagenome TaxID=652676 RepID=A0A3B1CF19_9ZZZZ
MTQANVVEVENVSLSFDGHKVLDNVSFSIQAGSFTGLIGPNGAGKTTILRVLLGLLKPDGGKVRIFGHPPGKSHSFIGYVPQSITYDRMFPVSVREVVMMGRFGTIGLGRGPQEKDYTAVNEALSVVGAQSFADQRFGKLSGGERQRALIARALCVKPHLLLLDEPTTGVDVVSQDTFYKMLKGLVKNMKMTIMLVSHDLGVITKMVDDLICINQKVFVHGSPKDVLSDGVIGQAYGCEAEILMHDHSTPHRVVRPHDH